MKGRNPVYVSNRHAGLVDYASTKRIIETVTMIACCLCVLVPGTAAAGPMEVVSCPEPTLVPRGSGHSILAQLSPDGRYVLFASTARNLTGLGSDNSLPVTNRPVYNVFIRDRVSAATTLVSVPAQGGAEANGNSIAWGMSAERRYVLFESAATDLITGDTNNVSDVFVRDTVSGVTILMSEAMAGGVGNGASYNPAMTPDGRFVVFTSNARNLVPNDTNNIPDVFRRDLYTGETILLSQGAFQPSPQAPVAASDLPHVSADGRYACFVSSAAGLTLDLPADLGTSVVSQVFLRDAELGRTVWVSSAAADHVREVFSGEGTVALNCVISADGRIVAYEASSPALESAVILVYDHQTEATLVVHTNAVASGSYQNPNPIALTPDGRRVCFSAWTNLAAGASCVLLWDRETGQCEQISGTGSGNVLEDSRSEIPVVTPSGTHVAFLSSSSFSTDDTSGQFRAYLRDRATRETHWLNNQYAGYDLEVSPTCTVAVSDDGATVAFEATSRNPAESGQQVFVRTFANGNTELVSASKPGSRFATGNGTSSLQAGCLSSSGETVVFSSWSTDLVPSDTNRAMDVFVRDMIAGVTLLASANTKGQAGNGMSLEPFLSSDGLKVAFSSRANDLVPGDTNGAQDVFVRDLVSGRTELLSKTTAGFEAGNKDSRAPTISSDGRFFFFRSLADNLVAGASTPGKENLFIRDREGEVTTALTTNGLVGPIAITADGSHVAAVTDVYYPSLYVWVTATRRAIYRNTSKPFYALGLSDGGARLAWFGSGGTFSDLFMAETGTGKLKSIGRFAGATRPGLSFSSQGKHFVFAAASSLGTPTQVYMHDVLSGTNCLVTSSYLSGGPANGSSDMPVITSDGRFVAFRSEASDLVPFDSNTAPDVFLHDLLTSTTLLVSASQIGAARSGNHRSGMPQFNGTGNVLMFQTFASDLFDQDFNGAMDLVLCRMLQDSGADLLLELVSGSSEKRLITWPAVPGHKYRVEFADSLENGDWRLLPGIITMLGAQAIIEDASQVSGSRFYRVVKY